MVDDWQVPLKEWEGNKGTHQYLQLYVFFLNHTATNQDSFITGRYTSTKMTYGHIFSETSQPHLLLKVWLKLFDKI